MGLSDVAGVFSRYFIVGFFLPSFFVLVALSQLVSDSFLPSVYTAADDGPRILILGGAALLVGLVLSGLHYEVLRLYEGYPLRDRRESWYAGWLARWLQERQRSEFRKCQKASEDKNSTLDQRQVAKWRLDLCFPWDDESRLLPTAFGNAVRAFERHPVSRWGLNGIAAWPHVEMLLSTDEMSVHADARGDLAFFLNGSLLSAVAAMVLAADAAAHWSLDQAIGAVVAVGLTSIFYSWAVGAASRWGSAVRASMDIHRREVYEKLGVRKPVNFSDERELVAPAINGALLRAEPIPDQLALAPEPEPDPAEGPTLSFGGVSLRLEQNRERGKEQT
jgi:hypothetical protein